MTSVRTISYAESNSGIFIRIAPLGITNTKLKTNELRVICLSVSQQISYTGYGLLTASDLSTIQFRLIFKGHKSLEHCCLVIHLTSVNAISYAESNGGIFILIAPLYIRCHHCH